MATKFPFEEGTVKNPAWISRRSLFAMYAYTNELGLFLRDDQKHVRDYQLTIRTRWSVNLSGANQQPTENRHQFVLHLLKTTTTKLTYNCWHLINYVYLKGIIFTDFTAIKILDVVICPEVFSGHFVSSCHNLVLEFWTRSSQHSTDEISLQAISFFPCTALSQLPYHFILCWIAALLYTLYSHYRLVNTNFLKEIACSLLIKFLNYTVGTGLAILEIRVLSKVLCPSTFVQCQWKNL